MNRVDPCNIAEINENIRGWAAPGESVRPVAIERIVISEEGPDALADALRSVSTDGTCLVVCDQTLMARGSDDLKSLVERKLGCVAKVSVRRLAGHGDGSFHAELRIAHRLAEELSAYSALISVGSGSITDVAKYARHLVAEQTGRNVPFISYPTAASVTAYTSALAVLSIHGVKRTLPARPPDVVICDLPTLAAAPLRMTQAGFGDMLARGVSYGDWLLASQLGMDDTFSRVPGRLLEHVDRRMLEQAGGVSRGDASAIRTVLEALLLGGMAMSLVNQTAPLSGWEHTISHFLDITAAMQGRAAALHGAQVGVATLIAARAYERAWPELEADRLTEDRDDETYREAIDLAFRHEGTNSAECSRSSSRDCADSARAEGHAAMIHELWADFQKKRVRWRAAYSQRRRFAARKRAGELDEPLRQLVRTPKQIEHALRLAGAPRSFAGLDAAISQFQALLAIRHAHLVRSRFTFGDLLTETGWLTESSAERLLHSR